MSEEEEDSLGSDGTEDEEENKNQHDPYNVNWKDMENIRVACRFRPINSREKREEKTGDLKDSGPMLNGHQKVKLSRPDSPNEPPYEFTLDHVFPTDTTQQQVFLICGKPMVEACMEGYNATIFAYGQTGSGKTFTMFGPEDGSQNPSDLGLVQRCVSYLFEDLRLKSTDEKGTIKNYNILAQFIQLYREQLHDLLDASGNDNILKIRFDTQTNSPYVPGLKQVPVTSLADLLQLLGVAQKNRVVDATLMNAVSSRSHMLMTLSITQEMTSGSLKRSKLNFIDLAGSESFTKALGGGSNIDQKKMQELKTINMSLTQLTTCINDLSKGRTPSYRSSNLTFMLMDSLGGNSKTTLLVACSPHIFNRFETVRTLRFAKTAKNVKNKAKVNSELSKEQLKALIKKLQRENKKLKAQLSLVENQLKKHGIEVPTLSSESSKPSLKKRKTVGPTLSAPPPESAPTKAMTPDPVLLSSGVVESKSIDVPANVEDELLDDGIVVSTSTGLQILIDDESNKKTPKDGKNESKESESTEETSNGGVGGKTNNNQKSTKLLKPSINEEKRSGIPLTRAQTADIWTGESHNSINKKRQLDLSVESEVTTHQHASSRKKPGLNRNGSVLSIANLDEFGTLMDGLDLGKEEVDHFVQELKELQDEMSKQEHEAQELREELQKKDNEMNKLAEDLSQSCRENDQLRDQIQTILAERERYTKQTNEMHELLQQHKQNEKKQYEKLSEQVEELKRQLNTKKDEASSLQELTEGLTLSNQQLEQESTQLKEIVAQLKQQHNNMTEEMQATQEMHKESEAVAKKAESLLSNYVMGRYAELSEAALDQTELELHKVMQEMSNVTNLCDEVFPTERRGSIRGSIRSNNPNLKNNIVYQMHSTLKTFAHTLKRLKEKETTNEEQMQSALARKDQELSNLQTENHELQLFHANALQEKEERIKQLEKELSELKAAKAETPQPKPTDVSVNDVAMTDDLRKQIDYLTRLGTNQEFVRTPRIIGLPKEMIEVPKPIGEMAPWRKALKVGSQLDGLDECSLWWTAQVVEVRGQQLKIRYDGFDASYDDWVDRGSARLAPYMSKASGGKEARDVAVVLEPIGEREGMRVFKQGFLNKQGGNFKTYRTRFFVLLENGEMLYYKDMSDKKAQGRFTILDMTETRRLQYSESTIKKNPMTPADDSSTANPSTNNPNGGGANSNNSDNSGGIHGFEIVTPSRTWRFRCESDQVATEWIATIHALCKGVETETAKKAVETITYHGYKPRSNDVPPSINISNKPPKRISVTSAPPPPNPVNVKSEFPTLSIQLEASNHPPLSRSDFETFMATHSPREEDKEADEEKNHMRMDSYMEDEHQTTDDEEKMPKLNNPEGESLVGFNADEEIVYSGWMQKQGLLQTNWKLRWFELVRKAPQSNDKNGKVKTNDSQGQNLEPLVFLRWRETNEVDNKNKVNDNTNIRHINLKNVKMVQDFHYTKESRQRTEIPTKYGFELVTPQRTYIFACTSRRDRTNWVKRIRHILNLSGNEKRMQQNRPLSRKFQDLVIQTGKGLGRKLKLYPEWAPVYDIVRTDDIDVQMVEEDDDPTPTPVLARTSSVALPKASPVGMHDNQLIHMSEHTTLTHYDSGGLYQNSQSLNRHQQRHTKTKSSQIFKIMQRAKSQTTIAKDSVPEVVSNFPPTNNTSPQRRGSLDRISPRRSKSGARYSQDDMIYDPPVSDDEKDDEYTANDAEEVR